MPRARDPNRDKAHELFKKHDGYITNREIANTLGVDEKVIAVWKIRDKWNDVQQSKESCTTKKNNNKNKSKKPIAEEVKQVMENPELTDKQRLFILYMAKCHNGTKAYQKAYECDEYTARVNASRLLTNASIKAEYEKLVMSKFNRAFLSEADIVQKYMDIAFSDITDYVTFGVRGVTYSNDQGLEATVDTSYVDVNESWLVDGTLISEISQGKDGVRLKLADRMKALDWLSKYFLMNPLDRHKVEYDKRRLELEIIKADHEVKKNEPVGTDAGADNFLEALNAKALEVWADEE